MRSSAVVVADLQIGSFRGLPEPRVLTQFCHPDRSDPAFSCVRPLVKEEARRVAQRRDLGFIY